MAYKPGKYLKVKIDGTELVGLRSKELSWEQDFAEATTQDSPGDAKEYVPTQDDATISFDGLHNPDLTGETLSSIFTKLQNKTEFEVVLGGLNSGDITLTANAYMSSITWSGDYADIQGMSGEIQRNGEFTVGSVT
jgi:hypothetical protein